MGIDEPTGGSRGAGPEPRAAGRTSAIASIVLGALFPVYIAAAAISMWRPLGLTNEGGDLLVAGWHAVPRLLLVLLFEVPLLVGIWLGIRACRRGSRSAGRVGIWLNGVGLVATLWATFLTPLVDAFETGPSPGFDWRTLLVASAVVAVLLRAALQAGTAERPR